jgi:hypothetical protein
VDGLNDDFLAESAAKKHMEGNRGQSIAPPPEPRASGSADFGPPETLASRRYANRASDIVELVQDFANWVGEAPPSAEERRTVVLSEIPDWYRLVEVALLSRPTDPSPEKVYGFLDVALQHGHAQYMASISPAAIDSLARGVRQLKAGKGLPTLEPRDVVASLTSALGAALTHRDPNSNNPNQQSAVPFRLIGPDLIGSRRPEGESVLLVHASLSSILWRSKRSRKSRRLVGGWLLLDGQGSVKGAGLYTPK